MSLRKFLKRWFYGSCPGVAGSFPYFGVQVYFPPQSESFHAACEQGIYEADIARLLQRLMKPNAYMFDVGANIGLMAIPVIRNCHGSRVVSFEPSPNSLPYLRRTIQSSEYKGRWTLVAKALADREGSRDFAVGHPKASLYEGFRSLDRLEGGALIEVPTGTLDAEWKRLGRPHVALIKIDVEGAEGLILRGGTELISTCRPNLLVEWHADHLAAFDVSTDELFTFAQKFDYRIYSVPHLIPVGDVRGLSMQMLVSSNFLLSP